MLSIDLSSAHKINTLLHTTRDYLPRLTFIDSQLDWFLLNTKALRTSVSSYYMYSSSVVYWRYICTNNPANFLFCSSLNYRCQQSKTYAPQIEICTFGYYSPPPFVYRRHMDRCVINVNKRNCLSRVF